MRDVDALFAALARSSFRRRFRLGAKEAAQLCERGMAVMLEHACEMIEKRLAPARPRNDGRQTPMRGHPVFIAQHATATCCRTCLAKWHGIPPGRAMRDDEVAHVVRVIGRWLARQAEAGGLTLDGDARQRDDRTKRAAPVRTLCAIHLQVLAPQ